MNNDDPQFVTLMCGIEYQIAHELFGEIFNKVQSPKDVINMSTHGKNNI